MSHNLPNCQVEYRRDENGKARTHCLTHGGVPICNVCHNNKEAHYIGPKLSHTREEYDKAEKEIEKLMSSNK